MKLKVQAKTFANNGSSDSTKAIKKFETFGLADETPTTSITGPSGVQTSLTFTITGTANDDNGVNSLRFTMRDANGRYLQDDGDTDTAYNTFSGQPDVIGATAATWSHEITLPYESTWTMQATAIDDAGQADLRSADRSWIVSSTAQAPSVAITTPAAMLPPTAAFPLTLPPGSPLTFAGSATDDRRLANVEIRLSNSTTRENLGADGTWGTDVIAGWHRLLPQNYSGSSYNWAYTTPFDLVPGTYSFQVRATDDEGISTSSTNYGRLSITVQVPDDTPPDTRLNTTGTVSGVQVLSLDLAGTATDAQGVASVGVTVRERNSGRYVQPNGTLSSSWALLPTTLATPGGHRHHVDPHRGAALERQLRRDRLRRRHRRPDGPVDLGRHGPLPGLPPGTPRPPSTRRCSPRPRARPSPSRASSSRAAPRTTSRSPRRRWPSATRRAST